jgi:hypothetical protein
LCNLNKENDIGIEIKKYNSPDWMQCSLKYDIKNNVWNPNMKCKNSQFALSMFNKFLSNIVLFNGKVPPFISNKITHQEWIKLKEKDNTWKDVYIDVKEDVIKDLYFKKGCYYIQLSNGYGLYRLNEDICNFNVPLFILKQQIRIRIKVHKKSDKNGYCSLSVMASFKPSNIKKLVKSKYSLDDISKLPKNLIYR